MRFSTQLTVLLLITSLLSPFALVAQDDDENDDETTDTVNINPQPRKHYWASDLDGAIFSVATLGKPAVSDEVTPLRFSMFFNFGANYHYDFSHKFGMFTGIGMKNIGFIEKYSAADSTVKRRVYTLGIPLGLKFGNLRRRNFVLAGGGLDFPINYKEKGFIRRGNKDKFNDWFSTRTPTLMPYVFFGGSFDPGITLKLQYYPGNFLNTDYTESVGGVIVKPYAGYDVHLILLTAGFDIHYSKPKQKDDVRRVM